LNTNNQQSPDKQNIFQLTSRSPVPNFIGCATCLSIFSFYHGGLRQAKADTEFTRRWRGALKSQKSWIL